MKRNPFLISGYAGPKYFCDREKETQQLVMAMQNQRHLTLYSQRRLGKSGLILHCLQKLSGDKDFICVYTDLMPTVNLAEFTQYFTKAVLSAIAQHQGALKKLLQSITSLRPTLSYDSISGKPEISVKVDQQSDEYTLEKIFDLMGSYDKHFIIALDEFQQINSYPENNIEALLRGYIQKLSNVTFIFSGSQKHILSGIFSSPSRPFFNSTEKMSISVIDKEDYMKFIDFHFLKNKQKLKPPAMDIIEKATSMHTYYVQFLCNRLWSMGIKMIGDSETEQCYRQILAEHESIFAGYIIMLTPLQYRLLRAISRDRTMGGLTSSEFLKRNNLGAASSVKTATKSLLDKEFLYQEDDKYMVVDKFFKGWLSYLD